MGLGPLGEPYRVQHWQQEEKESNRTITQKQYEKSGQGIRSRDKTVAFYGAEWNTLT